MIARMRRAGMLATGALALASTTAAVERPAAAFQCGDRDDAEQLERAEVAFDAWVLSVEPVVPGRCSPPPPPRARKGCIAVLWWDQGECAIDDGQMPSLASRAGGSTMDEWKLEPGGVTSFCRLPPGIYDLAYPTALASGGTTIELGPDRGVGTVAVQLFAWKARVGVVASLKGEVGHEVWVTSTGREGPDYHFYGLRPGTRWRILGRRAPDGVIDISECGGSRELRTDEVSPRSQPPAPSHASQPETPPPPARGGGCAAGSQPPLVLGLLAFTALVAANRRRSLTM